MPAVVEKGQEEGGIELLFPEWKGPEERVLIVEPHPDDLNLAAANAALAVQEADGTAYTVVVTDGGEGYAYERERDGLVERRRAEHENSCRILGVSIADYLLFPDGKLGSYYGTKSGRDVKKELVRVMRAVRATRVIAPHEVDTHNDHHITGRASQEAARHAGNPIWMDELGAPFAVRTFVRYGVYYPEDAKYSDLPPPHVTLTGTEEQFATKLRAIEAFPSQLLIIDDLISRGPKEFFWYVPLPGTVQ